jgi:hypothetical protein
MPLIASSLGTGINARHADASWSNSYFPRVRKLLYPEVCKITNASSGEVPIPAIGQIAELSAFTGSVTVKPVKQYAMKIPQRVFSAMAPVQLEDMELDQTGRVMKLFSEMGIKQAQLHDNLLIARLLLGAKITSTTEKYGGVIYPISFDATTAHFSDAHADGTSNIVAGPLPATFAALSPDVGVQAKQLIEGYNQTFAALSTVPDENGNPRFPSIEPSQHLIVVVPPRLYAAAMLAFATPGSLIGGAGAGSTSNIIPKMVKRVYQHGFLSGMYNPFNADGPRLVPANETDWYIIVDGDYVKPFGVSNFVGVSEDGICNAPSEDVISDILKTYGGITSAQATLAASNIIQSNLHEMGLNSSWDAMVTERFGVKGRIRGNVFYGPSFLSYRIYPSGGNKFLA